MTKITAEHVATEQSGFKPRRLCDIGRIARKSLPSAKNLPQLSNSSWQ